MQIYQILNTITGKSYVGKSNDYQYRFKRHIQLAKKKVNRRLYDSMNFHGYDNFTLILLEDLGDISHQDANAREMYWIEKLNTIMPYGYNMTVGGDGGNTIYAWSIDDKKELWIKQGLSRSGYKHSEETKCKMSISAKIRELNKTDEQRKLKSDNARKIAIERGISPPDYIKWKKGQIGTRLGIQHSEESKLKISQAGMGRICSDETKVKMSEARKGDKNCNFIEFDSVKKEHIIEYLSEGKEKFSLLSKLFNISEYKLRQWFREIDIDNYQQLGWKLNIIEWCLFWSMKNVN